MLNQSRVRPSLGKVFLQDWSASKRDIFGESGMDPKLTYGKTHGFQLAIIYGFRLQEDQDW